MPKSTNFFLSHVVILTPKTYIKPDPVAPSKARQLHACCCCCCCCCCCHWHAAPLGAADGGSLGQLSTLYLAQMVAEQKKGAKKAQTHSFFRTPFSMPPPVKIQWPCPMLLLPLLLSPAFLFRLRLVSKRSRAIVETGAAASATAAAAAVFIVVLVVVDVDAFVLRHCCC